MTKKELQEIKQEIRKEIDKEVNKTIDSVFNRLEMKFDAEGVITNKSKFSPTQKIWIVGIISIAIMLISDILIVYYVPNLIIMLCSQFAVYSIAMLMSDIISDKWRKAT